MLVFTLLRTVIAVEELLGLTAHNGSPVGRHLQLLLMDIADVLVIVRQLHACFLREEPIKSGSVQLIPDTLQFKLLLAGPTASLLPSSSTTLRRDIVMCSKSLLKIGRRYNDRANQRALNLDPCHIALPSRERCLERILRCQVITVRAIGQQAIEEDCWVQN